MSRQLPLVAGGQEDPVGPLPAPESLRLLGHDFRSVVVRVEAHGDQAQAGGQIGVAGCRLVKVAHQQGAERAEVAAPRIDEAEDGDILLHQVVKATLRPGLVQGDAIGRRAERRQAVAAGFRRIVIEPGGPGRFRRAAVTVSLVRQSRRHHHHHHHEGTQPRPEQS